MRDAQHYAVVSTNRAGWDTGRSGNRGGPGPGFQGLARANGLSLPPAVVGKSHLNHFYMFR